MFPLQWLWDPNIPSVPPLVALGLPDPFNAPLLPSTVALVPQSPFNVPLVPSSIPTSPSVPHPISAGHGGQEGATTAGDDVLHVLRFGADAGGDVDLVALGTRRGHRGDTGRTWKDTEGTQKGYGEDVEGTWGWDASFSPALGPHDGSWGHW